MLLLAPGAMSALLHQEANQNVALFSLAGALLPGVHPVVAAAAGSSEAGAEHVEQRRHGVGGRRRRSAEGPPGGRGNGGLQEIIIQDLTSRRWHIYSIIYCNFEVKSARGLC